MPRTLGAQPKEDRPQIPPGAYVFTLRSIKDYDSEDIYAEPDEDGKRPVKHQLIWLFESDKAGPGGKPYEFAQFTGIYYGDDRANLTHLLDWMLPDLDHDQKRAGVDVDLLIGLRFRGRVQMQPIKQGKRAGEMKPALTMIDPMDPMPDTIAIMARGASAPTSKTPTGPVGKDDVSPDDLPFSDGSSGAPAHVELTAPSNDQIKAIDAAFKAHKEGRDHAKDTLNAWLAFNEFESWKDFIIRGASKADSLVEALA